MPHFHESLTQQRLRTAAKYAGQGVKPDALKVLTSDDFDEIIEVELCREFKWTPDYVRSMGMEDQAKYWAILNGLREGENLKKK